MSEEKLKLSQKMFAALERLIRDTRIKDLELGFDVVTKPLEFSLVTSPQPLDFSLTAAVKETPLTITAKPVEIVHHLAHPPICDTSLDTLTTRVVDEGVETINTAAVFDEPFQAITTAAVRDLFREFNIVPGRLSPSFVFSSPAAGTPASLVKTLDFHLVPPGKRLSVHTVPDSKLKITARVKENLFYFKRLTTQKQAVRLSFLSEQEQLVYWKAAVLQTRREPRQLQIIGVYTNIPYDCVENLKVNPSQQSLQYNFKASASSRCQLKDIALFNDLTEKKVLVVVT